MDQRKGPYWATLGNAPPLSGPQFPDLDKTSSVPTCPLPCPSRTLTICDFLPTPSWRERGRPGSCLRKGGGAGDVPSCPQPPLGSLGTGPGWQLQPRHAGVAATGAPRCLPFCEGSAPLGPSGASEALPWQVQACKLGAHAGVSMGEGGPTPATQERTPNISEHSSC